MSKTAAIFASAILALLIAPAAQAAELAAHRAFYRLSLASAGPDSNMAGVEGAMSYELKDACDAWIVEQNFAMRFQLANGGEIHSVDKFTSWESKDGLEYHFNMVRSSDGRETERVSGRAELGSKDRSGMAVFEEPSKDRIALSNGTVFPTEHTIIILEKAAAGARFDRHLLFDGSKVEGAAPITTVILDQRDAESGIGLEPSLGPQPVWGMQLAFFAAEGEAQPGEELPDFQMTLDIQPNGIVTRLVMDFGDFTVNAALEKIEALPSSGC